VSLPVAQADDDVWFDALRLISMLQAAEASLQRRRCSSGSSGVGRGGTPFIVWGVHERWHWDSRRHLPTAPFAFGMGLGRPEWRTGPCQSVQTTDSSWNAIRRVGPFFFPKGPLFFLSLPLSEQLLSSEPLRREWNRTEAAASERAAHGGRRRGEGKGLMAWEDVFMGYLLSKYATGDGLVALHLGPTFYTEGFAPHPPYGGARRSTLVMHSKAKVPSHLFSMDRWAKRQGGCTPETHLACKPHRSCAKANWQWCEYRTGNESVACPTSVVTWAAMK